jgi:hypothetical protein
LQPGNRIIQEHGIPGIEDLFVGCFFRQVLLYFFQEFRFTYFAGLQVLEQGIGMELGEMCIKVRDPQIGESFVGELVIDIEEYASQVENDMLDSLHGAAKVRAERKKK